MNKSYIFCVFSVWIMYISVKGDCPGISNCMECSNPDITCQLCRDTKILSLDASVCEDCPVGCEKCTRTSNGDINCIECSEGYSPNTDSKTCISCGPNCEECDNNGNCIKCQDSYVLENNQCTHCPGNCITCPDSSLCSKCEQGYYKATEKQLSLCKACSSNCEECDSQTCKKCSTGYLLKDGECVSCPWKCNECISAEEAALRQVHINSNVADKTKICNQEGCADGYGYKLHDSCDSCPEHCITCNATDCQSCENGYTITTSPDGALMCSACPSHCDECYYDSVQATIYCDSCIDLYALNPDSGLCEACDENCLGNCRWENTYSYAPYMNGGPPTRVGTNRPVCGECKVGYGRSQLGVCLACSDNCLGCFDAGATPSTPHMTCYSTCMLYYDCGDDLLCQYFRNTNHLSDTPAHKYDFSKYVTKAIPYGINKRKRAVVPIDMSLEPYNLFPCCKSGYFFDPTNGFQCSPCPGENCHYCEHQSYCSKCDYGYDFKMNGGTYSECVAKCPEHCEECDHDGNCIECDPIGRIDEVDNTHYVEIMHEGSKCYECPRNCEASIEAFIQSDSSLKHCEYDMTLDRTVCKSSDFCRPGTSLTPDKQCKKCDNKNCRSCQWNLNAQNELISSCLNCDDLFARDNQRECRACPEHCLECEFNNGVGRTDCKKGKCDEGYVQNPEDGTCITCGTGCISCSVADDDHLVCSECVTGFILNPLGNQCLECPEHCDKCEFHEVTKQLRCAGSQFCTDGYSIAVDGTCQECPKNTKKCHGHESGVMYAELCYPYYYRNQEQCGACPEGCKTCTDNESTMQCSECIEGQILSNRTQACFACPSNCEICEESNGAGVCRKCQDNFHQIDGQCISCSDLYFDNCAECSYPNGECIACTDGYTFSEDGLSCKTCSDDFPGCSVCTDLATECTLCDNGLTPLSNGKCGYNCYACDHMDDCTNLDLNSTSVTSVLCEANEYQCAVRRRNSDSNNLERLCLEISDCPPAGMESECRDNKEGIEECVSCCTGDYCNNGDASDSSKICINGLLWIIAIVWIGSTNL